MAGQRSDGENAGQQREVCGLRNSIFFSRWHTCRTRHSVHRLQLIIRRQANLPYSVFVNSHEAVGRSWRSQRGLQFWQVLGCCGEHALSCSFGAFSRLVPCALLCISDLTARTTHARILRLIAKLACCIPVYNVGKWLTLKVNIEYWPSGYTHCCYPALVKGL